MNIKIIIDNEDSQSPLVGAISGFKCARGNYSLLLPCDNPLVSSKIVTFLFDISKNKDAVIPRWPNGYIEPLQAVYNTKKALLASEKAFKSGFRNMRSMINNLKQVRFVSTIVLQQIDKTHQSFFNINTLEDLKKAETFI